MVDDRIKVDWTDELKASVVKAWEGGATATEIALTVPGSTRSGILGIIHRAGKKRMDGGACRVAVIKVKQKTKPKPPPKPAPVVVAKPKLQPAHPSGWRPGGGPVPGHIPPEPEACPPLRLTLMELEHGCCRWPVSSSAPWFYCGLPVVNPASAASRYCRDHATVSVAPKPATGPRSTKELVRSLRQYL